jgi:hypothetical protein
VNAGPAGAPEGLRGAPGTRARSREIGYAEAMHDIWSLLRAKERQYQALAADTGCPALAAGFAAVAGAMDDIASYAFDAWLIHGDRREGDIESCLRAMWGQNGYPSVVEVVRHVTREGS